MKKGKKLVRSLGSIESCFLLHVICINLGELLVHPHPSWEISFLISQPFELRPSYECGLTHF